MKITTAIVILIILGCVLQPASSATEPQELPYLSLTDFLAEMDMDINEFIAKMDELAETTQYHHFLEKNAARYDAYQLVHPNIPFVSIIAFVNVDLDKEPFTDIKEAQDIDSITVLINKTFSTPQSWSPGDLTDIGTGHMMRAPGVEYMNQMRAAMTDAGLRVHLTNIYRSYASQSALFNNAVAQYGRAVAERNWARPGHSEHNTGLAADILHQAYDVSMHNARFQNTREFEWLKENAYKYGFILRYPDEYKDIHKFVFEPWHWRYVGVDIAVAMREMEIELYEDFYGRYIASDVLHRARDIINEHNAMLAAIEEAERLAAIEEAERLAAEEEAERLAAEEEAARLAAAEEAERLAAEEAARIAAEEEARRLAAAAEAAKADMLLLIIVSVIFILAIAATIIGMKKTAKKREKER